MSTRVNIVGPVRTATLTLDPGYFFDVIATERFGEVWSIGSSGSGNSQFNTPQQCALNADKSELWIVDRSNNRIARINTSDGSWVGSFGTSGTGDGQLSLPYGIIITPSGDAYVADTGNSRIQKFTSGGVYSAQWSTGASSGPHFIWYDEAYSRILVACQSSQQIKIYNTSGVLLDTWTLNYSPLSICCTADGLHVYVASSTTVRMYTSLGVYLGALGLNVFDGTDQKTVFMDTADQLYVIDDELDRLIKMSRNGLIISSHFSNGTGVLQLSSARGMARYGNAFYVVDSGNNRIKRVSPTNQGNGVVFRADDSGNVQITGLAFNDSGGA